MKRTPSDHGIDDVRAELGRMFDAGDKEGLLDNVCHLLGSALSQANYFAAQVAELRRQLYGRKSERINPAQLALAFAALDGAGAEGTQNEPDAPARPEPPSKGDARLRARAKKARSRPPVAT